MGTRSDVDAEHLWRRVGLDELHKIFKDIEEKFKLFSALLHSLPPCDECAKLILIEEIEKTGRKLNAQVAGLTSLAETLRSSFEITEKLKTNLVENAPHLCQCKQGNCICHHG